MKDLEVKKDTSIQSAILEIVKRDDINPDRLEKFLGLQIRMEERQAKVSYNNAMAAFQAECPIIKKTSKVDFKSSSGKQTKYNYSALDEIVHETKAPMTKHGFSYSFDVQTVNDTRSKIFLTIAHRDGHEKVFEYEFNSLHDDTRMNSNQRQKSAITYAKRAILENGFGVVTAEEDDDARRAIDTPITDKQRKEIESIVKKASIKESALFNFLKVKSLDDLSSYEAKKAIHALKIKRVTSVQNNKL